MKTATLLAFVAAATMGYASPSPAEAGGQAPEYSQQEEAVPSYSGGGATGTGGGSGGYGWPQRGGRFGGNRWGGNGGGDDDEDGGSYYGSCAKCHRPPPGYAIPPPGIRWPTDPTKLPPGNPFRTHFHKIGHKCSSVNTVGGDATNESGSQAAGCCNQAGTANSSGSGNRGLLGGLLNGLLSGSPVCTLDIASSICSSGQVTCCDTVNSNSGFSLINVQGVCVPISL